MDAGYERNLSKLAILSHALARRDPRGHLDYAERNLIEKWFQTLAMRIDQFYQAWMGGSAQRWLAAFAYYYNFQRPNQALDGRMPVEEVTNMRLDSTVGMIL